MVRWMFKWREWLFRMFQYRCRVEVDAIRAIRCLTNFCFVCVCVSVLLQRSFSLQPSTTTPSLITVRACLTNYAEIPGKKSRLYNVVRFCAFFCCCCWGMFCFKCRLVGGGGWVMILSVQFIRYTHSHPLAQLALILVCFLYRPNSHSLPFLRRISHSLVSH